MTATQLFDKVKGDFELARVLFPETTKFGELFGLVLVTADDYPDSLLYSDLQQSFLILGEDINIDYQMPLDSVVEEARKAWDFDVV